jgi:hypothetical protein
MIAYVSLALSFVPFWLWLHDFPSPALGVWGAGERTLDALWQSIRTMTTAGPEGTLCRGAKVLATVESVIGIYFLSIIVAGYVSWLQGGKRA